MIVATEAGLSVPDAFMFALRGDLRGLRREAASRREGTAHAIVRAALAQLEGDVAFALRILKAAYARATAGERAFVADLLIPLLISLGELDEVDDYSAPTMVPMLAAGAEALCAVVAACRVDAERSREHALLADAMTEAVDDAMLRARIQGRLALAAFYRGEFAIAHRLAQDSAALATRADAPRYTATACSLCYAIAHDVTGDLDAAARYADGLVAAAAACGDGSLRAFGLVATYELAAERADHEATSAIQRQLRAKPLPPQYRERFASVVADALPVAWSGDFAGFRSIVAVLRDTPKRSVGERALCDAFAALAAAALEQNDDARRLSRRALAVARPQAGLPAYERRYRRLARALGAAGCTLVGDAVRGRRGADVRFLREDPDVASLVELAERGAWEDAALRVRGYARLVTAARVAVLQRLRPGTLTDAEMRVVRELAAGKNAPTIARETGRSVHTIRTQTSAIVAKLGARGRGEALARARKLGIIEA